MTIEELAAEHHAMQTTLSALQSRVSSIELQLGDNGSRQNGHFDFARIKSDVERITQEVFAGACSFSVECDPEYPDDRYVVVSVETAGEPKELVARSAQWHERLGQLSDDCFGNIRLSIIPR